MNGIQERTHIMQMQASPADVIVCHAPATRERLGEIPVDGPEAVRAAVARARAGS